MNVFQVLDGDREVGIAVEHEDHLLIYDPHTQHFHRSDALRRDYYLDQANTYRLLDVATARARVEAGAGGYDARALGWLLDERRADPHPVPVVDLIGRQALETSPSSRQRAHARRQLLETNPGQWVTWQTYPRAKRQAARVAASQIRTGKVAALRDVSGAVDADVVENGDTVEVKARLAT